MDRISPIGDLAIKKVFGSNEHKECLSGFINDFLSVKIPQEDIIIEEPYDIEAYKEVNDKDEEISNLRETIKDVSASLKFADFVSEFQIKKKKFYEERMIYYPLKRYCQNYNRIGHMKTDNQGKPNRYSSLRPVYSMNILKETHFTGDDDALRIFKLYDPERNKSFKDLIKIGFFELGKPGIETINQRYWRDYFLDGTVSDDAPDYIKKASSIIEFVNLSEEERKVATLLERAEARRDAENSDYYNDGMEAGEAKERSRTIENMLNLGLSLETISQYTGLTLEQIKKIK